jgi:hypothetical protein
MLHICASSLMWLQTPHRLLAILKFWPAFKRQRSNGGQDGLRSGDGEVDQVEAASGIAAMGGTLAQDQEVNNLPQEVAHERCANAKVRPNDLSPGLKHRLMVPVLPNSGNAVAVLQYQNLLVSATAGGATRQPVVASRSLIKILILTDDDESSGEGGTGRHEEGVPRPKII